MPTSTSPHTALITGASRGLGLALARALAAQGWTLILDARGADALEAARRELAAHTHVVALAGDVTDPAHRQALAATARNLGGLDAVINNASILGPSPQPALLDYPLDVLAQVYLANTIAPLALLQAVRTHLRPNAHILNITSDAAIEPYEGWGGYGSSKAALEQLTNILAAEHPEWRVYWVDPGDMRTALHQQAFPGEDISDRPLPETSVPGLLALLTTDFPSGRYKARELNAATEIADAAGAGCELRVALTVPDFDAAARMYREGFGLPVTREWNTPEGRGMLLDAGRATLELLDSADSAYTDQIEAGRRVSGPVRLAFAVGDVAATAAALAAHGATAEGPPVSSSWGNPSQRLRAVDGMQLTLFHPPVEGEAEPEG
ncbi:MAG: putative oxidoreductase [Ktedonobacterales bacterium]|jgi:NAD(P)-dependent dehydrogenase (short-subunit alcohol dehydrogenase family)|nr:MAG: putative oxidoreductase [Ktedonobacterales bacterium]